GPEECIVAYDLGTGRVLWSHADHAIYSTTIAGEGPRATPTIRDQRVFSQGATGLLNCLDLGTGRVLWSKDVFKESHGQVPTWGDSSSPLVFDDVVVANAGAAENHSLMAFRVNDGTPVWSGKNGGETYSSPTLITLAGVRQVVLFNEALVGYEAT